MLPECQCQPTSFPFECPHHQCVMHRRWWELCAGIDCTPEQSKAYRQAYAEGRGPGQNLPSAIVASEPVPLWMRAWNLATALKEFISDGCTLVTTEQYRQRMEICNQCDQREDNVCRVCGCHLAIKAQGRAFDCPLERWPGLKKDVPESGTLQRPTAGIVG